MQQSGRGYPPPGYLAPQPQVTPRYGGGVFHFPVQTKPAAPIHTPSYPIHPDVKLKKLPFYEVSAELVKPSSLVPQGSQRQQDNTFVFYLSPQQATAIGMSRDMRPGSKVEFAVQVQLRFCMLETTTEQEDCFPPGVMVKVNNKICQLPNPIPTNKTGVEPKRPPRPVNITPLIKISPTVGNAVHIQWSTDYTRGYVVAVYLVQKKTSEDLLNRLKAKGVRGSDYTRRMIKDKLNEEADCEIATTSLRVSLVCPLGKMRMTTPCRASTCQHLQCFDASLYLQMNERKPTWMCPVCDKPAVYDKLVIDGYFQEVLSSDRLSQGGNEIQLHSDGSWSFLQIKESSRSADREAAVASKVEIDIEVDPVPATPISTAPDTTTSIDCDDDDGGGGCGDSPTSARTKKKKKKKKDEDIIDLTISDSDDELTQTLRKKSADPFEEPAKYTADAKKPSSTATTASAAAATPPHTTTGASTAPVAAAASASNQSRPVVSSSSKGGSSPSLIILDSDSPPSTPTPSSHSLRTPPPPYNSVVSYLPQCHFLDFDGKPAGYPRF